MDSTGVAYRLGSKANLMNVKLIQSHIGKGRMSNVHKAGDDCRTLRNVSALAVCGRLSCILTGSCQVHAVPALSGYPVLRGKGRANTECVCSMSATCVLRAYSAPRPLPMVAETLHPSMGKDRR